MGAFIPTGFSIIPYCRGMFNFMSTHAGLDQDNHTDPQRMWSQSNSSGKLWCGPPEKANSPFFCMQMKLDVQQPNKQTQNSI